MQVTVRYKRGGRVKTMKKVFADALIKLGTVEIYAPEVPAVQSQPELLNAASESSSSKEVEEQDVSSAEENASSTSKPRTRKRGKNQYKTRDMTAE